MRRLIAVLSLVVVVAALVVTPATAAPPIKADHLRAFNVTPPGQDGLVTADEFVAGDFGPHYSDQLEMYASLIEDPDVTEEELAVYLHSMQFAPDGTGRSLRAARWRRGLSRQLRRPAHLRRHDRGRDLRHGLRVRRGSAVADGRLPSRRARHLGVLRRPGRGGRVPEDGHRHAPRGLHARKRSRRCTRSSTRSSARSAIEVQEGLQAYTDGVNAYIDENAMGPSRPFEYEGTGNFPPAPEPWTVQDTLFLVVLQLRVFGETAGGELQNAGLLVHLRDRLGRSKGTKVFNDLMFQNDPNSPTSIAAGDANFRTQNLGKLNPRSVAIPDNAAQVAESQALREKSRNDILASMGFKKPASNAIIVSAEESATGNPLLLGGPQVGHSVPSFFLDISVHAPGVDFRGPAVPGSLCTDTARSGSRLRVDAHDRILRCGRRASGVAVRSRRWRADPRIERLQVQGRLPGDGVSRRDVRREFPARKHRASHAARSTPSTGLSTDPSSSARLSTGSRRRS